MNNAIGRMESTQKLRENELKRIPANIKGLEAQKGQDFKYEKEYQEKKARNAQLLEELGSTETVNEVATALPEYQRLSQEQQIYQDAVEASTDPTNQLKYLVQLSRINRLMERMKYAGEGKEGAIAATVDKELEGIAAVSKNWNAMAMWPAATASPTARPRPNPTAPKP